VTAKQLESYLSPEKKKELSRKELQEIWSRLTSGRTEEMPSDRIFLQDLARHYQFAESVLPDLIGRFHEVDADKSCSIERSEFDAFFGNGEAWLEARLANIIGLAELKEQIRTYYWSTRLDRMRRRGGSFVNNEEAHVLMFKGNPGVGKTTIARLITGLLHKIGVISTDNFVEVQRDQLVGDHIGATEKATEEAIEKARGGVLFVDEAYRLSVDVFGVEAINCLMKAMSVKGNVIILAGYPKEMDEFVSVNPGIKRRVTYEFSFPDYSCEDLAKIFEHQVRRRGFETCPGVTTEMVASVIERLTTEQQRATLNGGVGEHACRHAIFSLNRRQIAEVRMASLRDLEDLGCRSQEVTPSITLEMQDIEYGAGQIPDTSSVGAANLPQPFQSGKRPTHGIKRGNSGLLH
jgi:stage V sporulation protein K